MTFTRSVIEGVLLMAGIPFEPILAAARQFQLIWVNVSSRGRLQQRCNVRCHTIAIASARQCHVRDGGLKAARVA